MRVTRNEQGWLDQVVCFLNYRFDAIQKEDSDSLENLFDSTGPFVAGWNLNLAGEKERRLQEKLIRELSFVGEKLNEKALGSHLSALVQNINKLDLKTEWIVVSGSRNLDPKDYLPREQWPSDYNPVRPKDHQKTNLAHKQLGAGRKILKVQQGKYFVARLPWLKGDSLREKLYEIILLALQDGSFSTLKRCPWGGCKKFFIAKDPKRMFCPDGGCKDISHNSRRLKDGYFRDRRADRKGKREKQRKEKEREAQRQIEVQRFSDFLKLARGNPTLGTKITVFIKRRIDWNTVRGWLREEKTGKSAMQIWDGFSNQVKSRFRVEWKEWKEASEWELSEP